MFLKDVTEKKNWKFINTIDSHNLNIQKIELFKIKLSTLKTKPCEQNL